MLRQLIDVIGAQDYYAFGSLMPGRSFSSSDYRYGFNGKESDNEVKGSGNSYDFGARIYDPRIGRFLSTDPLEKKYAFNSPYLFAGNSPIQAIDKDGKKIYIVTANGGLVDATKTLLKTESGRALIAKYVNSKTDDIYIAVSTNFTSASREAAGSPGKAIGLTMPNAGNYVRGGKITGLSAAYNEGSKNALDEDDIAKSEVYEEASNAFKVFEGVDVSKSKGRNISLIVFDADYMKEGSDSYANAESIFHEIFSHIELSKQGITDTEAQHDVYGNEYYNSPSTSREGSASAGIQRELAKVKNEPIQKSGNKKTTKK